MPVRPRHRNRSLRLAAALVSGGIVLLLVVLGTTRYGWITMLRFNKREARLDREILVNLTHNEILKQERIRLLKDRAYIEAKAREELGMVKSGEVSYRFYPADSLKKRP